MSSTVDDLDACNPQLDHEEEKENNLQVNGDFLQK